MVHEINREYFDYILRSQPQKITVFIDANIIVAMEKSFLRELYNTKRLNTFHSVEDKISEAKEALNSIKHIKRLTKDRVYSIEAIVKEIERVPEIFGGTSSHYEKRRAHSIRAGLKRGQEPFCDSSITRIEEFSNLALLWKNITNRLAIYRKKVNIPHTDPKIPENDYLLAEAALRYADDHPLRVTVLFSKDYHLLKILGQEVKPGRLYPHPDLNGLNSLVLCRSHLPNYEN